MDDWSSDRLGRRPGKIKDKLIEAQHFNRLPMDIKTHWGHFVQEVIVLSDEEYLLICRVGIDFERLERLFRECVSGLIRDPWDIRFCVYDAEMANDFEVRARCLNGIQSGRS